MHVSHTCLAPSTRVKIDLAEVSRTEQGENEIIFLFLPLQESVF